MKTTAIFRFTVLAVLCAAGSAARAQEHAVGAKAGALGLGLEYTLSLSDRLGLRFGLNGSELGFDAEESGIDYEFDFVWDSMSAAVDFHPRRSPLRITGGLLRNDNRLEAVSQASGGMTIGGTTYSAEDIGTLRGLVEFDDVAPFVGLGWDWSKTKRFGVALDFGVVSQGSPDVSLRADGGAIADPMFESDIEQEEAELQASLEDFDLLPFATFGLVFRF